MTIRKANLNDYEKIKSLHIRNRLKILDKNKWISLWKDNPLINNSKENFPIGWVLEQNSQVVGFIGNIVKEYYLRNKRVLVACSHAWVVDEKFRLDSIRLMNIFFLQDYIDIFITTTPNKTTEKFFLRYGAKKIPIKSFNENHFLILNVKKFLDVFFLYKNFKIYKPILNIISFLFKITFYKKIYHWEKFEQKKKIQLKYDFSDEFENFWSEIKNKNNNFLMSKSNNWLNWHIKFLKKPWIVYIKDNNKILGFALCCERNNNELNLKRISIIDIVSKNGNNEIYLSLLQGTIKKSFDLGYEIIEMTGTSYEKKLFFSKFKTFKRKVSNYLFYYYSRDLKLVEDLKNENLWDTSLLDGDSFLV